MPTVVKLFLFSKVPRLAMEAIQSPIQWVLWVLCPGVKQPVRKANHPLPSSVEFKNEWSYAPTPYLCLRGVHTGTFLLA
jgi:hypothetical protein